MYEIVDVQVISLGLSHPGIVKLYYSRNAEPS